VTLLLLYIAGIVLAETLVVLLLWWAHLRFWRGRLELKHHYAHEEELKLPDGGVITLRRIGAPRSDDTSRAASDLPVLLVHGLAMNHRNHDTAEEASFARYLHRNGRDVWLLTLRSGRSRLSVFGPKHSTFAAMVKHDVPQAVKAVLGHTAKPQLDLAVFSMGGMLLYACLDRTLDSRVVRRAAVFASPAKIRPLGLLNWSRFLPAAVNPTVPMRLWTRTLAFAPRWVSNLLWRRLYNPRNVARSLERNMLWNVWEDIPGRLGSEFVQWSSRKGEITVDGAPVLPGLANIDIPACFFAGSVDWLAPVWTVRAGFEAWGSATPNLSKHFVVLGRENGMRNDYGHCDISFGLHVHEEVFEPAAHFLATGVFAARLVTTPPPYQAATPVASAASAA
jgi:polyhydroxyalkanoate synthase